MAGHDNPKRDIPSAIALFVGVLKIFLPTKPQVLFFNSIAQIKINLAQNIYVQKNFIFLLPRL